MGGGGGDNGHILGISYEEHNVWSYDMGPGREGLRILEGYRHRRDVINVNFRIW